VARRKGDDIEALIWLNADLTGERYWAGVVGINVRRRRKDLGWNQSRLACELRDAGWHMDQKTVSALESNVSRSGTVSPSHIPMTVDRLMILSQVLHVTHIWLMNDQWHRKMRDQ
jgi:transcriptional regulator with XRE-family HTH domain